jgi:GntR family transcriptional regulator, transcriptional repressor for pyruvate dehydrogenase complex
MSKNQFSPVQGRRLFEEVLEQLEDAIAAGELAAGDRLPPERDLAQQFEVSRTSVREAIRVLEALGLVTVARGAESGGVRLREKPGNAFTYLLRLYLSLQHASLQDVIDFLIVTSGWAARVAAGDGANATALAALGDVVDAMANPAVDAIAWQELDANFHSLVVQASNNKVAGLVLEGLNDSLKRLILAGIRAQDTWEVTRARLVVEHRDIFDAITARDADRAEELMTTHLTVWCERATAAHG